MAQHDALNYARRKDLQPGESRRTPERRLGKAVGQATAKGDRRAVFGKEMNEVRGETRGAIAQGCTPRWINIGH